MPTCRSILKPTSPNELPLLSTMLPISAAPKTPPTHICTTSPAGIAIGIAGVRDAFIGQFSRDILGAFRLLQDEGFVEILTSAATHAYLPLLANDSSIRAQLRLGINSYQRHFGRLPRGIWLPECAYRPAYYEGDTLRPGIEHFLADAGLQFTFGETHAITGGRPVGIAAGDVLGPYGEITRRYAVPIEEKTPSRPRHHFSTLPLV